MKVKSAEYVKTSPTAFVGVTFDIIASPEMLIVPAEFARVNVEAVPVVGIVPLPEIEPVPPFNPAINSSQPSLSKLLASRAASVNYTDHSVTSVALLTLVAVPVLPDKAAVAISHSPFFYSSVVLVMEIVS